MRRKAWLVILSCVALGMVTLFFRGPTQVKVQGRTVGFWLDDMAEGGARSNAAVAVFLQAGEKIVPALTNELRFVPPMRTNLIQLKARLPWALASRLPRAPRLNYSRRYSAAHALGQIGPEAKSAVPALLAAVTTGDAEELMMRGQNGGMMVGQSWSHGLRATALDAISRIDTDNEEASLVAAGLAIECGVGSPVAPGATIVLYESAMRTLEAVKNPSAKTVEQMLEIFRGQEREAYFRALTQFAGSTAPNRGMGMPLNELHGETNTLRALKSKSAKFREAAAFELGDPDREGWSQFQKPGLIVSEVAVLALVEALRDSEEKVRLNAAETLVKAERKEMDREVVKTLAGLLDATNSLVRLRAVDNLGQMRQRAATASGKLEATRQKDIGIVRVWAERAIGEIEATTGESARAGTNQIGEKRF